jgi:peroxiredoxin
VTQLCQHKDELEQLDVEVLLVSFSSKGYARRWINEVCSIFQLLLDREKVMYRTYGLDRSFWRTWNLKIAWSYVKLMRAGRRWQGIQGDSMQMGGDFIIDSEGVVRFAYRSRDPADRPAVEQLMRVLRQIHRESEGT